jgi:hypothetical protein
MRNDDTYLCYVTGWKDGASLRKRRDGHGNHPNRELRQAYQLGYAFGQSMLNSVSLQASHFYEYHPTITKETPPPK